MDDTVKKLLFIINPVTAKSAMTPYVIDVVDLFEKAGYAVHLHISQSKGDVTDYVRENGADYDTVVCAGGDGTLNETISGALLLNKECRPKIGYLPSGTTNDFAKSWGIPQKPIEAAKTIANGEASPIDVSTFCSRPYVYVAAFGAFTKASYATPQDMKKALGYAAYLIEGAKSIPTIRPYKMKIEYDGGVAEGDFLYGMISNTRRVGGFPLKMKDDISLSDGLMELILVRKPDNPADDPKMISAFVAQDISSEYITFVHTKNVRFTSNEEVSWTVDGECGGSMLTGEAGILENAIELYH